MDSRKSFGGESLYSCTFIINVSHNFYKNLFGFLQNLQRENLRKNGFSYSRRISSPAVVNVEGALKSEYIINHRPMYRMAAQAVSQVWLQYDLV